MVVQICIAICNMLLMLFSLYLGWYCWSDWSGKVFHFTCIVSHHRAGIWNHRDRWSWHKSFWLASLAQEVDRHCTGMDIIAQVWTGVLLLCASLPAAVSQLMVGLCSCVLLTLLMHHTCSFTELIHWYLAIQKDNWSGKTYSAVPKGLTGEICGCQVRPLVIMEKQKWE